MHVLCDVIVVDCFLIWCLFATVAGEVLVVAALVVMVVVVLRVRIVWL